MNRFYPSLAIVASLLTPLWAFAQDGGLGAVAPFVNADTVAIVRVDLKKADIPAAVKSLTQSLPKELLPGAELKEAETKGEAVRKALVDNGVSEAFAVVGNFDLRMPHESFFIVLPVAQGKDPQAVIAAIEKKTDQGFVIGQGSGRLGHGGRDQPHVGQCVDEASNP